MFVTLKRRGLVEQAFNFRDRNNIWGLLRLYDGAAEKSTNIYETTLTKANILVLTFLSVMGRRTFNLL